MYIMNLNFGDEYWLIYFHDNTEFINKIKYVISKRVMLKKNIKLFKLIWKKYIALINTNKINLIFKLNFNF